MWEVVWIELVGGGWNEWWEWTRQLLSRVVIWSVLMQGYLSRIVEKKRKARMQREIVTCGTLMQLLRTHERKEVCQDESNIIDFCTAAHLSA